MSGPFDRFISNPASTVLPTPSLAARHHLLLTRELITVDVGRRGTGAEGACPMFDQKHGSRDLKHGTGTYGASPPFDRFISNPASTELSTGLTK